MKARVHVFYKPSVFDPQGDTVRKSLNSLGFDDVANVRVGKTIDIELEGASKSSVETSVQQMCDKLLVNPVIESFSYEVIEE